MKKMMKENHSTTSLEILLKRNLKLTRASKTNERLDKLCQEIVDLTASLEFILPKIEKELVQVKKKKALKTEIKAMEDNLLNAYGPCGKLIELDYGSQTIESIKEEPNETWEAWEKTQINITDKLQIEIDI